VDPGGQLDMQQLLQAAAAMQSQLMSAQQELADAEIEGSAGGGLVTVTVNGQGELVDVTIAPTAIDGGDPAETAQTIADLILAAYRDACQEADDLQQETMAPFAAGLGSGGLPGMPDLTGFPGLPGASSPAGSAGSAREEQPSAGGPAEDSQDRES
jgi:DNA-binding YbaB/EbfC family protein